MAATLTEPTRTALRDAVQAQREGRLTVAARVTSEVARRPALRWPVLLLALEDAELRLGGAVVFDTPRTRFTANQEFPLFEERWGVFGCTVWPEAHRARLLLAPGDHVLDLKASAPFQHAEVRCALSVLAQSLEDYFGVRTRLIDVGDEAELERHEQ